jgi:Na+:H+ antiporter, NhaA family
LAIVASNTSLDPYYDALLATPLSVRAGSYALEKPLLSWINDGLMAVFFFLVGLEIKKEVLAGALSSLRAALLPLFAAIGGMVVPAMIFLAINQGEPAAFKGWAIPTATDIAFAMGVLALLGPRVPAALRVFLLALAIIDDLGGIVIIALFYAGSLSFTSLTLAAAGLAGLALLNRCGVLRVAPYVLAGLFTWVCVLKSGVHATLAGVAVALAIPLVPEKEGSQTLLERLKHDLEPWVAFLVLPAFAFANAGLALQGIGWSTALAPLPLGIALGLFAGKQIGIVGAAWCAVKLGLARLPDSVGWRQIHGAAALGGIGFTMSLFIGSLAFSDPSNSAAVRIGVLAGSLASGIAGYAILRRELAQSTKAAPGS